MKADLKKSEKKHEISFKLKKSELRRALKNLEMKLFYNKLIIDGEGVIIPGNSVIDYKVKYENDNKYVLAIRIEWAKEIQQSIKNGIEED